MGGDHAPDEVVTGALLYARAHPSEEVLLIGDEDRVRAVSGDLPINATVIHAAQAVGTPVLGLFGVTLPGPILTDGSRAEAIVSDPNHPSSGARHRAAGTTFTAAANNPMDTITEAAVFEKAVSMLPTEL